ncbi:MAG: hypothetical protein ACRENJ_03700 [Candidatus Eiseniibacteriota bacterium]
MSRRLVIALSLVGVVAVLMWAYGAVGPMESLAAPDKLPDRVMAELDSIGALILGDPGTWPNTSSKDWKPLSKDVGLMVRRDDRFGLRGRLFVRVEGRWVPVAIDGPGEIAGIVLAR